MWVWGGEMKARASLWAVPFLVGVAACASAPPSDSDTGEASSATVGVGASVASEVRRVTDHARESHYEHTTHVVESEGVYDVDCSGFVNYVLGRAASDSFAALTDRTRERPLAEDYVRFFDGLTSTTSGWRSISNVADLAIGDVIAWLEPIGAIDPSHDTGHVMVVRGAPTRRDDASFLISVWDSVERGHGSTDSRAATGASGIGHGNIVLFVDREGAPTGHAWQDGSPKITSQTALGRPR